MDEIKEDREGFLNGFLRGYEISEELEGNTAPQGRRSFGLKMTLGGQDMDQKPAPYLPEQDIELLYPKPRLGWGTDTARQEELVQSKLPKIKDARLIARSDWAAYPLTTPA